MQQLLLLLLVLAVIFLFSFQFPMCGTCRLVMFFDTRPMNAGTVNLLIIFFFFQRLQDLFVWSLDGVPSPLAAATDTRRV